MNQFDSHYVFSASDLTSVQADDVFLAPTKAVVDTTFDLVGEILPAPFLESESIRPINILERHSSIPPPRPLA